MDMIDKKYKITADNYISDEYSICREERQYALFLYNILRKYNTPGKRTDNDEVAKILNACGVPSEAKIEKVFYEATLMRDFFERNRRLVFSENPQEKLLNKSFSPSDLKIKNKDLSFNAKLIKFVTGSDTSCTGEEYNLGGNKINCDEIVKEMMNATPDIAVIYNENGKEYLLFIECKFESGEDTYKSGKSQCEIQWKAAAFLCENYLTELEVAPKMENEKSRLVQFVRKKPQSNSNEILINELIELNDNILS